MHAPSNHCFVVPAYGESPYLEACLRSLATQEVASRVLVATSTPNRHIETLARRYHAPLHVNPAPGGGIGADWNFALDVAPTPWVTLAHQDDLYLSGFTCRTLAALDAHPEAVLAFCNYGEIELEQERPVSTLLRIKRVLLELGFLGTTCARSRFFKTNALRFGCAIPCPAVTLNVTTGLRFRTDMKVDLDWAAWLELARRPGSFIYVRECLMHHRVHPGSETTAGIGEGRRAAEDRAILRDLWPAPIAAALVASYAIAYRSNRAGHAP